MADTDVFLAYRATDPVEAHALAAHLDGVGYEARVVGDFQGVAFAGLNPGGLTSAEVWVASSDRAEVEQVVAAWRGKEGKASALAPTPASPPTSDAKSFWIAMALAVGLTASSAYHFRITNVPSILGGMVFWSVMAFTGLAICNYLGRELHEAADSPETTTAD